jgi:Glycosyltransferase
MKLAILTCGMLPVPAVQGGAVENLIDFYLEYNNIKKLHDITVYSPWDPRVTKHPALLSNVNHYVFIDVSSLKARIKRKLYGYFHHHEYYNHFIEYYFERVYSNLKKKDYDYIIIENGAGLAYKLSLRGYKNLILHMHNEVRESQAKFHDVVFGGLTKILTVSDYIKRKASVYFPIEKIQTVHNGIDLQNFFPKERPSVTRESLGFAMDDFIMVYSGRINPEKGVSELIDAMLKLKDNPHIKLMIIGGSFFGNTNDEDQFIRSLKEKAKVIQDNIIFTGFIPYKNMPDYLQLSDIAVIPSIWNDPFPTTELEAQAMGLPIITTLRGGIPEEVSEGNAILLETDDSFVNSLSNAIINLYEHPEKRKKMSEISIERSKLFDKETYAEHFFDALKNLD